MKRILLFTLVLGFAGGVAVAAFQSRPAGAWSGRAAGNAGARQPAKLTSGASSEMMAAWQRVVGSRGGFNQRLAFMAMIARATSTEIPLLLSQSRDNMFARDLLLLRWVEIDPEAAGDWITPALRNPDTPGVEASTLEVERVLSAWARKDPKAALAKVQADAGPYASTHQSTILQTLLTDDMEKGLAVVGQLKDPIRFSLAGPSWVSKDPEKAAHLLSAMPQSDFRNDALMAAMGELGAKDLAAGIALLERFPTLSSSYQQYLGMRDPRAALFEAWAKQDINAMTAFLNDKAEGPTRSAMKEAIAKVIGDGDPKAAFEWAAENLSGARRSNVVDRLITKLAKEDPAGALDYLVSLPPGTALSNACNAYSSATYSEDGRTTFGRVQSLPEGAARTQLMGSSLVAWYVQDPAAAIAEARRQPATSIPDSFWSMMGNSSRNVPEALKLLQQVPSDKSRMFVEAVFANHYSYAVEIGQRAKDLDLIQDRTLRSAALEGLVQSAGWRDRNATITWAAKLPTAEERQLVQTVFERRGNQLTSEERTKLLGPGK